MNFSVIIPTLNEEKYLSGILDSLVSQTHNDFEVIVCDSPKTSDDTKGVALKYKDKLNLKYVVSDKGGVAHQRNYGAKISKYDNLVFFDADTSMEPLFLDKVKVFLSSNSIKYDIITCWVKPLSEKKRDKLLFWVFNNIRTPIKNIKPIVVGNFIFAKKEPFFEINGFDSKVAYGEDSDLALRLVNKGYKYALLKDPVIYFSVRRLDINGRLNYIKLNIGAALYYFFKGSIKDYNLFKYEMDGKVR